jgi:hypothetical protein
VAYGTDLRWLTLDDIVEKLLRGDLKALSDALAGSADDGLFSARAGLLTPLRDEAASELNADVIEAVLSGDADHAHVDVVSAEYASNVRTCVLGALRQSTRGWPSSSGGRARWPRWPPPSPPGSSPGAAWRRWPACSSRVPATGCSTAGSRPC